MTKKITDLTEVTQTEDGDLLLIRDATDGVDKKMQAQNLRAKATTKADVGLADVPDLDTTDAVNKAHDQNTDTALDQGGANEVTAADARAHIDSTANPHGVTKSQVGLGDVDNVSAADLRDRSTHTGTQAATTVTYDNLSSGLSASDVKAALDELADLSQGIASFTYNSNTVSPASESATGGIPAPVFENLYSKIKGCTLLDNGSVNYYLNGSDWSLKEGGGSSDLTGTDGQVMVEIPAFYYRVTRNGSETTWQISYLPLSGFSLHPAFIVDGVEVSHRYYSAYDACVYDDSASAYISGTNNTDNSGNVDTGADLLASVKGIYPMVGLTRNEFRLLAANRGSRWRQVDFPLWCAVGMLYVVEYQTFYNQDELGDGNTNGGYVGSSSNQNDSPHTIAGAGDSWGNGSTDGTQPSAGAKPGTAYMKYRGIENQFGNCWNSADAINVNVSGTGNVHIANDNARANYADDTTTDYTLATSSLTTGSDNIQRFLPVDPYFLAESVGGSSAQYITDRHYGSSSSNRVFSVGGNADSGGNAGVFTARASVGSGFRNRRFGGRLAY